jgi:2-polyprenyl-3-methyl-5-hydroxy-6-metoxy-1,4-benzoquinol methylase
VNFSEQQKYLKRSRVWAAVCVFLVAWAFLTTAEDYFFWGIFFRDSRISLYISALIVAALAGSLFYTPDYLHLNVNLKKRARWQIKIRWRLIAAALVVGLLSVSSLRGALIVLAAVALFAAANWLAKFAARPMNSATYFWRTDFALLGALSLTTQLDLLVVTALAAAAAHLQIVANEKQVLRRSIISTLTGCLLVVLAGKEQQKNWEDALTCAGLILVTSAATAILVARAQKQNNKNVEVAIRELQDFTGYSAEKIRQIWAESNEKLALNWVAAHLDESDREKMTAWYRENSELYMFAISGYNLEYKRIRDSIKMLRYGRGACLDYGAGNGEIILELARRGHTAIYFDVDGTSMRFARHRAERQKLAVEFFHSKDDLAVSAKQRGLDTIFSFDVLEHLPDLPGELMFLASLLNPDGRMAFDVPAGSTKSHPMHLNHHLDIHAHMASIGMVEERGLLQRIPFHKQEKYVFRRPA